MSSPLGRKGTLRKTTEIIEQDADSSDDNNTQLLEQTLAENRKLKKENERLLLQH
jgi:hypothetical protein